MQTVLAFSLFAMLAPSIAIAQTTQCFPNNPSYPAAGTTCYNNAPPPMDAFPAYQGPVMPTFGICGVISRLDGSCARRRDAIRQRESDVAGLIQKGDCSGAINRALKDQDFVLAKKAKDLCTPTQ